MSRTLHSKPKIESVGRLQRGRRTAVLVQRRTALERLESRLVLNAADMRFVEQAYLDLLGRPSDATGLTYWTGQLDGDAPQSGIAQQLTHGAEYYGNEIIKPAYEKFLGRDPDTTGLNFWIGQMQNGLTDEHLESGFIGSTEFYTHAGGTDLTWVDAMYQDLLGRAADWGGETFWVGQLHQGASRSGVAYGFAASLEREGERVQGDYQNFLRRGAAANEVDYWVGQFAKGTTNESVIGGFVGSPEYFHFSQTSPDTQPPTIVSTYPANGASTNLGSQNVQVVFSKPIDPATITAKTVQLQGPAGAVVPTTVVLESGGGTAQLIYPPLALGDYQLTIHAASIADTFGNALGTSDVVEHFHVVKASDVWINSAGGDWNVAANWSTGAVPRPSDDALINVPGATVTYSGGATTIKSLVSANPLSLSGGSITVTGGASELDGALTISNSAQLVAEGAMPGPDATLTVKGAVSLDTGAELLATGGGLIDLSALAAFTGTSNGGATIQASGAGSKVDLSNLTVLHGANDTNSVSLSANQGALLDLHRLTQIPDGIVQIDASDPGSTIDLSALTTFTATFVTAGTGYTLPLASLAAQNGGTVVVPQLSNVANFTLTLDGAASSINTSQLTNIDTLSLFASNGAVVDFRGVTSYTGLSNFAPFFEVSGAGSTINLSNLTALHGATNGNAVFLQANGGALLDLHQLTQIHDGNVDISAGGPAATVDLSSLTTFTAPLTTGGWGSGLGSLGGATVLVPMLTSVANFVLTVDGPTSNINTSQMLNIDTMSVSAQNGAEISFPGVTSLMEAGGIVASGAGSRVNLPNLTVLYGATNGMVAILYAYQGGTLDLHALTQIPDGSVQISVSDAGSTIDLSALTTFTATSTVSALSTLVALNGGTMHVPLLSSVANFELTVDGAKSSMNTAQITDIDMLNVNARNGAVADLSGVTSCTPRAGAVFTATGAGSKIDLSNLTVLHGATSLTARQGGLLDLHRLTQDLDGILGISAADPNTNPPRKQDPGSTVVVSHFL